MTKQLDLDRIKRNVATMAQKGAPVEDIDGYIAAEGATLDQIKAHKISEPGIIGTVAGWGKSIVGAVKGKQDPAFADLPDFASAPGIPMEQNPTLGGAKMFGTSDAQYGDIVRENLGDRFVKTEKDANGYDVVTYKAEDGTLQKAYVNRPGLDWQDVDRGISQAVPYILGATVAGKVLKPLGVAGRMVGQGATAGAVSLGADAAAKAIGSDQPLDLTRAGFAAAGGAIAEGVAPAISAFSRHRAARAAEKAGLTPELRAKLEQSILSPADLRGLSPQQASALAKQRIGELTDDQINAFVRNQTDAASAREVASKIQTDEFDIPTTLGRRTKDRALLMDEKDALYGRFGQEAKDVMQRVDDETAAAIRAQTLGGVRGAPGGSQEAYGLARQIAPTRTDRTGPMELGTDIRAGLRDAKQLEKAVEKQAWERVKDMTARPGAFDDLPKALAGQLGPLRVNDQTPTAMRMASDLQEYVSSKGLGAQGPAILGQTPIKTIDEMRRTLGTMTKNAAPGSSDAAAASAIYNGFNDWIEQAAKAGKLNGTPEQVADLIAARQATREIKQLFAPTMKGRKTAAAKILEDVIERADSPERVVYSLFGASGGKVPPRQGVVEALTHVKMIKDRMAAKGAPGAEDYGRAAKVLWDDVRLAYWHKMVTNSRGEPLTPNQLVTSLQDTMRNQKSVMNVLFSKEEQTVMKRFLNAVKEASYVDPNPSGSGSAILRAKEGSAYAQAAKTFLNAHASRESLVKGNILRSRVYRMIAKVIPEGGFINAKSALGRRVATQAASQEIQRVPRATMGGYGAAIGAQIKQDDQ